MTTLGAWRTALDDAVEGCPWPGARPLDRVEDQRDRLLAGRSEENRTFARLVLNNDVVVLTGRTGVGKSSLLNSGLRPALQRRDFEVITCNFSRLARAVVGMSASNLIARLADRLPDGVSREEGDPALEDQLDRHYANTAVIVLDQFEELIRYQPEMYPEVLDWIHETASQTHVRIVISLRIEFEHQLHGHGGLNLGPFQQARLVLAPVFEPHDIEKIIQNQKAIATESITPKAVQTLVKVWNGSGAVQGRGDVGLLHLQAALCVLWSRTEGKTIGTKTILALAKSSEGIENVADDEQAGDVEDAEGVRDLEKIEGDKGRSGAAAHFFRFALAEYVRDRLNQCRAACAAPGVDLELILTERASDLVIAVSRHLSSGGYKVPQSVDDLAELVLFDEAGGNPLREGAMAPAGAAGLGELARAFADTERRGDREAELSEADDWLGRPRSALVGEVEQPDEWPWEQDPLSATGGPLLGLRAADSAVEEYRAFYFALEWLRSCALISSVAIGPGRTMVQLVHDGFDAGLERWRSGLDARAVSATHRVTAVHGAMLDWRTLPMGDVNGSVHANLRWTSCDVRGYFVDVVFVNCDFTRTSFRECSFEGVVFVNCVLDDVEFSECQIVGRPNPAPTDLSARQLQDQPAFDVDGLSATALRAVARYRGMADPSGTTVLFSETSGLAAVPAPARAESDPKLVPFSTDAPRSARQPGGLTMFGSRLSSLKFARCDFGEKGWLALRHVAGTSVEIAEQTNARIEVFAAALRGLTVTTPIEASTIAKQAFTLTFTEAHVLNTWFGWGLSGTATITSSRVWQLFNASDRLSISIDDSEVYGSVNVGKQAASVDDKSAAWMPPTEQSLGDLAHDVKAASEKIDYRTHPARFEVERADRTEV